MFAQLALASLNHLLGQNSWASKRLMPFSGKTVRFDVAPFSFSCTIDQAGMLRSADTTSVIPDACYILPPSLLPRIAARDENAYAEIGKEGDPELLAEILYILRNLNWDAAEDLSKVTGDVAAERIVQAFEGAQRQLGGAIENIALAASEYWTEERPLVVKPLQVAEFIHQVELLGADIARLESRVQHLLADK